MKDLAVLIPAYNDQAGLDATLDSIHEPDNSFTVVIVDDGSTVPISVDPSLHPFPITLIRQEKNGGIVRALNAGLQHIIGAGFQFVARLDAADLNNSARFHTQYQFLAENRDIHLVGSNATFRSESDDRELFVTNLPLDHRRIKRWMVFRNCFIHPTVMLRTACLAETGNYDDAYPHVEDFVFFSRIVERFPCANLPEPLVDCYVRGGGISMKYGKQQLLSGMRFSWAHKKPFNPLWYAYMTKRLAYFALPFGLRNGIKNCLGFVKKPALTAPPPPSSPLSL